MFKISIVAAMMSLSTAFASTFEKAGPDLDPIFKDKPYGIDLREIASLDPRPLKIAEFSPDADKKVQGVRIVSTGRIFPFTFEVITFPTPLGAAETLDKIGQPLMKRDDIVALTSGQSKYLGLFLNYFQRTSVNGKPHHVSSNWIFVRDGVVYHVIGTSFAAMMMPRDDWGPPGPDPNANEESIRLLRSLRSK